MTIIWLGWAGWALISRSYPYELRVLDDLGAPVASAVVDVGGRQAGTSGADGRVELVWNGSAKVLEVSAPGHVPVTVTLQDAPEERFDVVLKAKVLRGRVVNGDGVGVDSAAVQAGSAGGVSDFDGYFEIRGAEEGTVQVSRPAWLPASFDWQGGTGDALVTLEPFTARAVHISGEMASSSIDQFIDMATSTELNALMIDLKDETGNVWYDTANPIALEVGANADAYDLSALVARAHDSGLYVIGRLVLFNDPIAALNKPEIAVWDSSTQAPYVANGQYFLDPTDPVARQYGLDLAVEACRSGLDEIQFDYVRFPDARTESATFDGGVGEDVREKTITGFLVDAAELLRPLGCAVAADVFGYLTTETTDGGIGQKWEEIANTVDVVSPMLYPSHYHPEFFGFSSNDNPGEVVDRALEDGMARLPREVIVRPWLQDFAYGPAGVREQIVSAERYGLGWMLWNAQSHVTVDALQSSE